MKRLRLGSVGVAILGMIWPAVVLGQPIFADVESIEATVINADLVCVGTLLGFDETEGPEGFDATLLVDEAIKVPVGENYTKLSVSMRESRDVLDNWRSDARRLLVAVREDSRVPSAVIDLESENLEILSAEPVLLRDGDAVMKAAREAIGRMPANVKRLHTVLRDVPRDILAGTRWELYDGVRVHVPVDERLEQWAREAIGSEDVLRRLEAIRALRYFRSNETIALLKPLLDDPGWAILRHAQENEGREVRRFPVRREVYRTLKAWGVAVDRPVMEETIDVDSDDVGT